MLTDAACQAPARPVAQGNIVVMRDACWIVSAAAPVSIFNCMRVRFRKLALARKQAIGNRQSGEMGRTAGVGEPALVLRDSLRPPQGEGSERVAIFGCGRGVWRVGLTRGSCMGRVHGGRVVGGADAIDVAEGLGEGARGCVEVHDGAAVGLEGGGRNPPMRRRARPAGAGRGAGTSRRRGRPGDGGRSGALPRPRAASP